jgi:2,4-dienoyl-CoA reductase (NADPH2)
MDGPRVRTPLEVLAGPRPEPCHALVIDAIGFHQATGIAEYLAEGGCRVSMVTSAFAVGQQLGATLDLELWHARMGRFPEGTLALYPGHIVLDVNEAPLLLDIYAGTRQALADVGLIVPVNHGRPRDALFRALEGRVPALFRVGDALAPKDVGEAILDGHRAARRLCGMELSWQ